MIKALILAGKDVCVQQYKLGIMNVLKKSQQCYLWQQNDPKPAFDIFHDFSPNLILLHTKELTKPIVKCLANRPEIKILLLGSNYGIDGLHNTTTSGELELVEQVVKNNNLKTIISNNYLSWLMFTHGRWNNLGLKPTSSLFAFDNIRWPTAPVKNKSFYSDITYIGRYIDSKKPAIHKYLAAICYDGNLSVKIFGYGDWPLAEHLGSLQSPEEFGTAISSAKINLGLNTDPNYKSSDRIFKILGMGGYCLCEESSEVRSIFSNRIDYFDSVSTLRSKIEKKENVLNSIDDNKRFILEHHTYHDRLKELLINDKIGIDG